MSRKPCQSLAAGALLTGLLMACSDDPTAPAGPTAELRLLHATSNLGALDVEVASSTVIQGITFGNASAITPVPAGLQHLTIRSGGTVVGQIDANLTTEHINAVTVVAGVPQLSSTVVPDTGQAAPNRANLRLVNVVGSNTADPTLLHVLINFPGVNPDSTARIGLDTKVASYGALMYFDPGSFRLRYVPQGQSTVLAETTFNIAAGEKKAVVLERDAAGTYRIQVLVEQ
ncbi:MAG TPA: DUF4397 domain-containing protein [Gemmatimonadales bacterium]